MLDNKHNIRLRLVLDNRLSSGSTLKGVKDPEYPVAIGIFWKKGLREKISIKGIDRPLSYTKYTFKNNKKHIASELSSYDKVLDTYNNIINSMPVWNYDTFKSLLADTVFGEDISLIDMLFDDKIRSLDRRNMGSGKFYDTTRKSLIDFHGTMPSFEEIDVKFLEEWQAYHKTKNTKGSGFSKYASSLRAIFNLRPDGQRSHYPFGGKVGSKDKFAIKSSNVNKFFVPREVMIEIKNAKLDNPEDKFARDMFLFSFYSVGMNLVDILNLKWSNYNDVTGKVSFSRSKSMHNEDAVQINFKLSEGAIAIINEHGVYSDQYSSIFNFDATDSKKAVLNTRINDVIRKIAKDMGYSEWKEVTFYRARHSFATNLRDAGVSLLEIKEYLGHESLAMTSLYLGALEESSLDNAKKIMDNLL